MYFSEIIELQFGKKCHTLICILLLFRIIIAHSQSMSHVTSIFLKFEQSFEIYTSVLNITNKVSEFS